MKKNKGFFNGKFLMTVLFLIFFLGGFNQAQSALTLGKTYDKTNYKEIEEYLFPALVNWVKKGDFVLNTGKLNFDYRLEKAFLEKSQLNAEKFDLDNKGYIIDKQTGKIVPFIYGHPFPKIDPKDPKAGEKILHNYKYTLWRVGGFANTGAIIWVGESGREREIIAGTRHLPYQGRFQGPLPNPNNFLYQTMTFVIQPMDLRGTVSMSWDYNDDRESSAFAYVPMLRRVRRTSPSVRSDPFMGSDFITDGSFLWSGKNQTMKWRLLGEKTILVPFTSPEQVPMKENPDGTMQRNFIPFKIGFEAPGWKGAPWAPVTVTWHPKAVYLVEAIPRDLYYSYGKSIYYVDKTTYLLWVQENYDKAGLYWKTDFVHASYQVTPGGRVLCPQLDGYCMVDDKIHHASYARTSYTPSLRTDTLYFPTSVLGPDNFTENALIQLSK